MWASLKIFRPIFLIAMVFLIISCGPGVRGHAYRIGGTIEGLGGVLIILNNNEDPLTVLSNGEFYFDRVMNSGDEYTITVLSQPAGQTCQINQPSGTVDKRNIESIQIICTTPLSLAYQTRIRGNG